jgi:hypothetical protein
MVTADEWPRTVCTCLTDTPTAISADARVRHHVRHGLDDACWRHRGTIASAPDPGAAGPLTRPRSGQGSGGLDTLPDATTAAPTIDEAPPVSLRERTTKHGDHPLATTASVT